jgi:hypothetical protein
MRPALLAGIAGVGLGVAAILDRGVAGVFDLDYLFVTFLGVVAGTIGIYYLSRRRRTPRERTSFDDPERRYRAAVPGDDLDERIRRLPLAPGIRGTRRDVRDRLREAAVRSLVTHAGYEREAARNAVESGEWTDDPVAASFLAEGRKYPPGIRVKALFGRVDLPEAGARRSVEAIVAVIEP